MRLRCSAEKTSNGLHRLSGVAMFTACLGAFSFFMFSPSVQAEVLHGQSAAGNSKCIVADNSAYDGATLPPPAKKKNQVTISTEDAPDDAPRKKKHKRIADSDTDSLSAHDATGGATLPPPKKGQRPGDFAGARAAADDAKPQGSGGNSGTGGSDRRGGREHGGGNMFGKGPLDLTALSLTDDQKQKIAQMHADNGQKMRELMRKRGDLSGQMRDVMFQADSTESQIRAKRDEVRQIQEKLEDLRLNDFLSIRSLLTPEQKLKLKDVKVANKHEGEGPPGGLPKRAEVPDSKRLADTPPK